MHLGDGGRRIDHNCSHSKLEANVGYIRPLFQKKINKKRRRGHEMVNRNW